VKNFRGLLYFATPRTYKLMLNDFSHAVNVPYTPDYLCGICRY